MGKSTGWDDFQKNWHLEHPTHRAMFKLGAKKLSVSCFLVKNMSAVYSADRCNFKES